MIKSFFAAFSFLTVLRLPRSWIGDEKNLADSVWFFPVVGMFIGGVTAGIAILLHPVLPPFLQAILMVMGMTAISGAMHLDGLADTADGFFSSRPRGKVLEIMHDSRIGTMGVLAISFTLLLKIAIFHTLIEPSLLPILGLALLMPIAGRCALVFCMVITPYARDDGLATLFWHRSAVRFVWALLFLSGIGYLVAGTRGLAAAIAALAFSALFCWYCYRKIGGGTGDTLGAGCELVEVVAGLAFLLTPAGTIL